MTLTDSTSVLRLWLLPLLCFHSRAYRDIQFNKDIQNMSMNEYGESIATDNRIIGKMSFYA